MSLLTELSSQAGDRTEAANRAVVARVLEEPSLLAEIAAGLPASKAPLLGDCAEVFTQVAEVRPDLVVPYAEQLEPLLAHKTTRVRWEAMHALALIASWVPEQIARLLPQLHEMLRHDTSTIVRDYAIDAISQYGTTSEAAARQAYPLLKEALGLWEGKHRGRCLKGFAHLLTAAPELTVELRMLAEDYLHDSKPAVKKSAKELIRAIEKSQ